MPPRRRPVQIIDGKRYVIPGDWATVDADACEIARRGSGCINTGGEKVFPEEVEAVLQDHPAIYDAVVVEFGRALRSVDRRRGGSRKDASIEPPMSRAHQAGFFVQAPRHVIVAAIGRGPNAKPGLSALRG
jgi:acyl-CoA synthetase (AMP-forming)/AMP-acid ligase II